MAISKSAIYRGILIAATVAAIIMVVSFMVQRASGQEVVERISEQVPTRVEYEDVEEEYEVEVTKWVPTTEIVKRKRIIQRPVFIAGRMEDPEWVPVGEPTMVMEVEEEVICCAECGREITTPRTTRTGPIRKMRSRKQARDMEPEVVSMQMEDGGVISVPRVQKTGPMRQVERRDTIIVDGFEGTQGEGGTRLARRPHEGFGGVQVGLLNRNNQPFSNAVIDEDENVRFQGPIEQRLNSVQADVDGDFGSEEQDEETNVGPVRRLLRRGRGRGTSSSSNFRG